MNNSMAVSPPVNRSAVPLIRGMFILAGAGIIFSIFIIGVLVGFQVNYAGKIYPGVSVAGIDVSGLDLYEATDYLAQNLHYSLNGRIAFQDGNRIWMATPLELGLFFDAESSALAAYRFGRQGGAGARVNDQYQAWNYSVDLPPLMIYDERSAQRYLENIAAEIDLPVIEAQLGLNGIEVNVRSGQIGRELDIQSTLPKLDPQFNSLSDGVIPLNVVESPPIILDVTEQAQIARQILSSALILTIDDPQEGDPGPWTFDPPTLAELLSIERVQTPNGAQYQVGLKSQDLRTFLDSIGDELKIQPVNSNFIFNDETRELELIKSAVIGRQLLVDETIQAINSQLADGTHTIPLVFERIDPLAADDATAESLGITELVSNQTSYFYGSSGGRIQNIQTAAASFHGLLIAPGDDFSMADALGDVSLDNGYAEALIIFGNRTIKGVGGGVCQVSTTLFRTVFFGGFPVAERHPHAYRVYYYELTSGNWQDPSLAGLDATVYVPLVDFKFTNDTPYWMLMETYVDPGARTLNWRFYSTSDGREVSYHSTGLRNRVEPPEPLYTENPDLAEGEIRQVDWAVEGADVTVTRTVNRNGEAHLQDSFFTHYMPWRSIYEYGPGTEGIPTPEADKGEPAG